MDEFILTLYMVLGVILRIGIPLVITFLLTLLLRRLDNQWREEALHEQPGEAVLREMWLNNPCWEQTDCIEELRESCSAFSQTETPCWEVYREDGMLNPKCQVCEYRKELLIPVRMDVQSTRRTIESGE